MKVALLIVLSLSALAYAGPAVNKNNQIDASNKVGSNQNSPYSKQESQYMTGGQQTGKSSQVVEILKQWCFSSQMSQPELTSSFKKLVQTIKSQPDEQTTEATVMSERICQGAIVQKSAQSGETVAQSGADAQAHELIKDVYMDALIACETRQCKQQLIKIIDSQQVDSIRASYYMTRIAVTEKDSVKDESEIKQLAQSLINESSASSSEAIERQKLFATTSLLGKAIENKQQPSSELKQTAAQVAKTILERYVKSVNQGEAEQYKQQTPEQQSAQVARKIAKRNAALKALTNIPGSILKEVPDVEQTLIELSQNKQEMSTTRQSAIECLEQNENASQMLKQITFDQQEPIEVRVAALRALMTSTYSGDKKDEQTKQQMANQIIDQVVKHCEDSSNQQSDDQFVLYAVSYLDNLRTSQQPEHEAIKECISKNKQHYMQIQLLNKKFKQQLSDVRKSSRNYKFEQEFNQLESGLIIEGDLVYESKHKQQQQQYPSVGVLPKLVRVNMSMPVMGQTVNVVEITVRQNQMDEELLSALKLVQGYKFNSESMGKVVDSFKSGVQKRTGKQETAEADLTIKSEGMVFVYMSADDFKTSSSSQHQRNARSTYSIVDEIIEHLKRKPVSFNRGFNFNLNERFAKVLDVEANVIAGLRFDSRASGRSSDDFEISAQVEPRFAFEAIVGPAKMSSKKLMQRVSTKTALGLRLRYKSDELVDVQVDLPMNNMELFTVETQMVEKSSAGSPFGNSYTYLPESIYGQEDIYSYGNGYDSSYGSDRMSRMLLKRSIFDSRSSKNTLSKMMKGGKSTFAESYETSEKVARATGLRGKLRMVVSPKDMSLLVQAECQKYEPTMQGYRFEVQKVERNTGESKQYTVTISTPGSRIERTMQVRLQQQSNSQRVSVKADIQAPKMSATCQVEVVHDGRQYSVKIETAGGSGSSSSRQWRHTLEAGVQRSGAQSGRISTTYKPYLAIDSTSLRHPIQMQGALSYQEGPKSVISCEFKCPTTGDFVQGKFILENRPSKGSIYASGAKSQRAYIQSSRRSMRSPIEALLDDDYTVSGDFAAQVREHELKFHKMLDWDSNKKSVALEATFKHKNLRKNSGKQVSVSVKANPEQQLFTMERDSDNDKKDYRVQVSSVFKPSSGQHQLVAEARYNGRRQSLAAYKHKVELSQLGHNKVDIAYGAALTISELNVQHQIQGRTQMSLDRRQKLFKTELSGNGNKYAKLNVDYISLGEHQIYLDTQYESLSHRTTVRNDRAKLAIQSNTEWKQQQLAKLILDLDKQRDQCDLVIECEPKNLRFASDLKFNPGQTSSVALQAGRYTSKAEFSFDKLAHSPSSKRSGFWSTQPFGHKYHFKSDLKDSMNQQNNYWIDSAFNTEPNAKSYLRFSSPIYRSDFEYDSNSPDFAKIGMFARSKRSVSFQPYSIKDSILNEISSGKPLRLDADKVWMLRSVINTSPQKLRKVLFDYADQYQQHQHSAQYNPMSERFNLNLNRLPGAPIRSGSSVSGSKYSPIRISSDFGTSSSSWARPSTFSVESDLIDMNFDAKPFDGSDSYVKLSALSRNRRSPFNKHESQYRYDPKHGYKAWMKHEDSKNKHHSFNMEADAKPQNWAKMSYDSDKHGKASYEHNWRKHQSKRSTSRYGSDRDELVYANKVAFDYQAPRWTHSSQFDWQEPVSMYNRYRRDVSQALEQAVSDAQRRYTALDYLKHTSARVNSQTSRLGASAGQYEPIYKFDFDYKPTTSPYSARLNLNLADQMLHESALQFEPSERAYKLQSKYSNLATKQPSYEFLASTLGARSGFKSSPIVEGLATSEQEPVFVNEDHPMYERAIRSNSMAAQLFKQPLKLDYSDKYGRQARFDYDLAPYMSAASNYAGLRQKRAALYYKDDTSDFEHSSSYDFYPEQMLAGGFKKQYPSSSKYASSGADFTVKAHTKYGPVLMRADSDDNSAQFELDSPVFQCKLSAEGGKRDGAQLIKFKLDNKQQNVDLLKIVRKSPIWRNINIAQEIANMIDSNRFEHQTELFVSLADAIIKSKSETKLNGRQSSIVVGEFNKPQQRCYAKIDGERTNGHLLVDLNTKSAELDFDVDNKRTVHHKTRLARASNKFYALESYTTYKQQPLLKLSGKIAPMVIDEPQHLFSKLRSSYGRPEDHISIFEATIYEPKPIQMTGVYDCLHKEARFMFNNQAENKVQQTVVKYDEQNDTVLVDARLKSPKGPIYSYQAKVNVPGLLQSEKCYRNPQSCQSEASYSDKSGYYYSTKYVPGEYLLVKTPTGKQAINLAY